MIVNLGRWDSLSGDSRLGSFHLTLIEEPFTEGEAPDLVMAWAYNLNAQGQLVKPNEPGIGLFIESHFAQANGVIFQEFQLRATGTDGIEHRIINTRARLQNGSLAPNEIEILVGIEANNLLFKDPHNLQIYAELNRQGLSIEPVGLGPGIKLYQSGTDSNMHLAPRIANGSLHVNWYAVHLPGVNLFNDYTELKRQVIFDYAPRILATSIELGGVTLENINGQLYWNGRLVQLA